VRGAEGYQAGHLQLACEGRFGEGAQPVDRVPLDQRVVQADPFAEVVRGVAERLDGQLPQRLPRVAAVMATGSALGVAAQIDNEMFLEGDGATRTGRSRASG
jgi:hypothetical protein